MSTKDRIDLTGASALVLVSLLLGLNQVLVKLLNQGMQPVFSAGLRSVLAFAIVLAYALWRKKRLGLPDGALVPAVLVGTFFAFEFMFLFKALDLTTVTRASIFFYSMPIWMTLGAHFLIEGERITTTKFLGLALAMAGVTWAFADRGAGGGSIIGDLMCALGAICWAGIGLTARTSRLNQATPETQLLCQLAVSGVILLPLSFLFGPLIRDFQTWHVGIFALMTAGILPVGFLIWLWILSIYPTGAMASFSFLTPVFGVIFGWLILGEEIGVTIIGALLLISLGIVLINRKTRMKNQPRPADDPTP